MDMVSKIVQMADAWMLTKDASGMPLIHRSSKAIAEIVVQGKSFEDTGVPAVFKPTMARLLSQKNEIIGKPPARL
jgi:predicted mannosyl-3-phosphoglycerate phosphatase (HAD superfamily)